MKPQYAPKTLTQKLGYLIEEMGEVQAAVGKSIRWGLHSYNPEVHPSKREMNGDWILREIADLELAIKLAKKEIKDQMTAIDGKPRDEDCRDDD
jgi:NTP pyrophosphatase (non-canonical NTP hydrolase)